MVKLKPFMDYTDMRLAENVWNSEVIFAEIKAMGYTGGRSMLRYYIQPKRKMRPSKRTVRFETQPEQFVQMRRDFCDIRVNILFEQGALHPGQRFAFFTKTLLACELHLLFQDADTVLKLCILSHDFLHHGNYQSAKLFRATGSTEKRDIHAVDYTTSRMDTHIFH